MARKTTEQRLRMENENLRAALDLTREERDRFLEERRGADRAAQSELDRAKAGERMLIELRQELSEQHYAASHAEKKAADLGQELSDLRVKHHQLIGYCDRVREEDAMRETGAPIVPDKPPAPPEGWYRRGGPWTSYTAKG